LGCHPTFNDAYELQPALRNGRAQYATRDGTHFLYWRFGHGDTAEWVLDEDTDDASAGIRLISSAEAPPTGSAVWIEFCSGQYTNVRLRLAPGALPDATGCATALGALAPRLTSICCGPEDGTGCGQTGAPPSACSVDCAHLWAPHARQCPAAAADMGDPALTAFFGGECAAASAGLAVLSDTATIGTQQCAYCGYTGDGECDEPQYCAAGTDNADCRGGIDRQEPCCQYTGDQECDEPQLCPVGTDNADCRGGVDADGATHEFAFEAQSGVRYQVDVRVVGDRGVTATALWILPPGATDVSQAVATQTAVFADKGLSFTAAATGTFTARVYSVAGSGPVTVTATAVGTATERSPPLVATGSPRPLTVSCLGPNCAFGYDGAAALDGDGSGFDLLLEEVQAGQAYAFLIELPAGQTAAQVSATFYQAGAAAGAAGFEPVASGPLGDWTATPAGHQSLAEYYGCSNDDRSCLPGIAASFGIHPGGAFPRFLRGTWVATASGAVLLRLMLNCDVPVHADAQADGCTLDAIGINCQPTADDTRNNGVCASELRLTVTPDAYYDQQPDGGPSSGSAGGAAAAQQQQQQQQPISGGAERTDTLVVNREEVEAQALILWQDTPAEQRTLAAPPTVDEMLVSGSEANALLASMFTTQQPPPHVIYPLSIQASELSQSGSAGDGYGKGGHRRQLQGAEPEPEPEASLTIQIKGLAPTRSHLDGAFDTLALSYGVCMQGPGVTTSNGHFDYKRCSDFQFRSCHADVCAGHGGRRLLSPLAGEVGAGCEAAQAEIQELRAALAERNSVLAEREAMLAERDTMLTEQVAMRAEKDTVLAEQVAMLAERDTLLAERDSVLERQRAELETLRREAHQK
jgi:hypothetical protein